MLQQIIEPIARILELGGVAVIVGAIILALTTVVREYRHGGGKDAYDRFRAKLGRGILLGLELMVGADIINTVTSPMSWESVGLLGLIVLIRTFLSFSLEVEIDGVLPWQRRQMECRKMGNGSGGPLRAIRTQ